MMPSILETIRQGVVNSDPKIAGAVGALTALPLMAHGLYGIMKDPISKTSEVLVGWFRAYKSTVLSILSDAEQRRHAFDADVKNITDIYNKVKQIPTNITSYFDPSSQKKHFV